MDSRRADLYVLNVYKQLKKIYEFCNFGNYCLIDISVAVVLLCKPTSIRNY